VQADGEVDIMNMHMIFGFFALYVAGVSLFLVLTGRQEPVLLRLRRLWGRTLGLGLYFVVRVALPALVCVLCLGWGVRHYDASLAGHHTELSLHLNVEYYRNLGLMSQRESGHDLVGVIYGA